MQESIDFHSIDLSLANQFLILLVNTKSKNNGEYTRDISILEKTCPIIRINLLSVSLIVLFYLSQHRAR